MRSLTPHQIRNLVECPSCNGKGVLQTPSRNWTHHTARCADCMGAGYVTEGHAREIDGKEEAWARGA